ncbi:MAG: hypothetical protein K2Y32_23680 [Candidatus Obscuribacterales bacterium]|nr:hypothetical protein [Candidatus Obscuribacterales bacterium]
MSNSDNHGNCDHDHHDGHGHDHGHGHGHDHDSHSHDSHGHGDSHGHSGEAAPEHDLLLKAVVFAAAALLIGVMGWWMTVPLNESASGAHGEAGASEQHSESQHH